MERTLFVARSIARGVFFLLAVGWAAGCETVYVREPDPVTTEEILRMTKEGKTPDEIIRVMDESHTVYRMSAKDVVQLHEQGVDDRVIDFMLDTERRDIQRRCYPYHYHYHYDPYWYPYPPPVQFGFGWGYWW